MEVINDINTYLSFKNKDGTISNEFIFIYAKPGFGKSLVLESGIEELHRAGCTIIILSDVKDEWELAYAMFPPKKPYHLMRLRKDGKPIETKEVLLYHPLTTNIPNKKIPEMNFYGFPLKNLGRSEWSMIAEAPWESDAVRLLLNASSNIKDSDGIYNFLHSIQEITIGKKEGKEIKPDPKLFQLRIKGGVSKSLTEIASYFFPFRKHPFLTPNNSEFNLDWKEIMNDNHHYHVFGTCWLGDEKLKELCILALFNSILKNKAYAKKPIVIIVPEIRFLVPFRPEGYKKFLAQGMKSNISIMRNMGRGMHFFADSQVWSDVDDPVRNSATQSIYGQIGGNKDIENISKGIAQGKADFRKHLQSPEYPRSYLLQDDKEVNPWVFWLPGHCHAEPEYSFFEMYHQHFPEKMKRYNGVIEKIKKQMKDEEEKIKERNKRIEKAAKEEKKKKLEEKEGVEKKDEIVEKKTEELKEERKKSKEQFMKLCYEKFYDESLPKNERSYRKIGEKFELNHITVKNYIIEYKKILNEKNSEDFEDKIIDELENN